MRLFRSLLAPIVCITAITITSCGGGGGSSAEVPDLIALKVELGRQLFFDTDLSTPPGQSCATCHDPAAGFADPNHNLPVSQGVHTDRFGNRNSPTAAYASFIPEFNFDGQRYIGGQFLDGRAPTLVDQAKGPFLNPLEMANPDKLTVVDAVRNATYAALFEQVYGADSLNDTESAYNQIADAIAAFESTDEVSPFTSKFDYFLKGEVLLSDPERRGFILFDGKGLCFTCHVSPLFTDHTYSNLGVPKNPDNPFYNLPPEFNPDGAGFIDLGLGANPNVMLATENGKFRIPTLRNISLTAPYMHNGAFQTLEQVVQFYNTRDVLPPCPTDIIVPGCWPAPEVADNVDTLLMGNLGLTDQEMDDIVAFLQTLTDGFALPPP